jgi:bacillithiol biosynthesis cysteine-adding enzyme BshC
MKEKRKKLISQPAMDLKKTVEITTEAHHIPYPDTGYFADIVLHYLEQKASIASFYRYAPDVEGVRKAISDRTHHAYLRKELVTALKQQYSGSKLSDAVSRNLELLAGENTFTITTAHQPNIFTGPLYFIYKIVHAIKLADTLSKEFPANHFVPVFFMGSEDADIDELGHFVVEGKKYEWKTMQTGAVGRMKVDKELLALIGELQGQLDVLPFGEEIVSVFKKAYQQGRTIQQCTLELVNELFGQYGLIVLVPDDPALKKLFQPVVEKELKEQFSHQAVEQTITALSKHYKVQAGGRALNLFYLIDDKRERITFDNSKYKAAQLQLEFTETEILKELSDHPERFSPNVILRGVFQEMILPNIAFIGGGGEIAYWLELKKVFEDAGVPYPILVLRNSFLLMRPEQQALLADLGFSLNDFFKKPEVLLNELALRESANKLSLAEEAGELNSFYQQLHEAAIAVDITLGDHVNMLQARALKRMADLEKKMLRAEKKKFEAEKRKIQKLKHVAFPNGNLQERVENISGFYAREGRSLIDKILQHSLGLEQQFTVITI